MFNSSAKSKTRSEPSSSPNISLKAQCSDQDQSDVESSHKKEQPRSTPDFSVNQESGDAIKSDLGSLVDDLRAGMSTMNIKTSDPVDSRESSSSNSSNAVMNYAPKLRVPVSEYRATHDLQAIASRIAYHRGPFSYGTRRIPDKRLNRSYATRSNNVAEREARRAALDIAQQRMKESEARILARQRKRLQVYSSPRMEHGVEVAWPMLQYAARRSDGHLWPMLFFDITRDPCDPTAGAISLRFEGNQEVPEGLLSECMKLAFSPITSFSMLRLKGKESELDQLEDVVVNRLDGIRVIDIFSAIFNAYNVPLTFRETFDLHDLINTSSSVDAYHRRSKSLPIQDKDMFRVDLLGKKTLFNGVSFDDETGQFYFRLLEQHPDNITLTTLF